MRQHLLIQGEPLAVNIFTPEHHRGDAILVHGFTGSKEDFDYIVPYLLEAGYRVVVADNRGAHESSHSTRDGAYLLTSLARDVIEIARQLELESPHLFGHSLGGVISQYAVVQEPELFASLTLMCSGPSPMPVPRSSIAVGGAVEGKTAKEAWEAEVGEWYQTHPRFDLMKKRWLASDARALGIIAKELATFTTVIPAVAAAQLPVHVIYGENDDAWPLAMQDQMAADLSAELTVLKDSGHCPNEDQPEATARTTVKFWDLH